jgi:ubiquinone/menaquinone biosynthesis C-methylase UbiE
VNDPDGKLSTQDVAARHGLALDARPAGYFDATAELWDAEYDHATLRGHLWRSRLAAALALIGDGPGRLLEVGTGPGRLIAALASRGWEVTGIDASPRMLELARTRVPPEVGALLVARAEHLPFDGESFDFAVGLGVFEFTEIERSLREVARVLRQGGTALIGLRNADAATRLWQRRVMHPPAQA